MRAPFVLLLGLLLLTIAVFIPRETYAAGLSFGGRILLISPCISASGPSVWITIQPAGRFPITYIWAPGTIGLPPTHPGQSILGIADIPYVCKIGTFFLYGQRIQRDAVSI